MIFLLFQNSLFKESAIHFRRQIQQRVTIAEQNPLPAKKQSETKIFGNVTVKGCHCNHAN